MLMTTETERLILKPLTKDFASYVLTFYEENKSIFEPWEPIRSENFYTLAYQKASLTTEYHQMIEGKLYRYWVFFKDNPHEIIGTICFQNFLKSPFNSCSIGYKFSQNFHNKGYAQESIYQVLNLLFQEGNLHRVEAYIMPDNLPSIKLIHRLGFMSEGISYSYAKINGRWENHLRFSIINPAHLTE